MHASTSADRPARVRSAHPSVERALFFLMACLPYCNLVRLPPTAMFWGEWVTVTLFAFWWVLRPVLAPGTRRAWPWSSVALLTLSVLMLVQQVSGKALMPMAVLLAAAAVALAAAITAASSAIVDTRRRTAMVRAFAWGLVMALALNALEVALGWAGYEIMYLSLYPAPVMARAVGLIGQSNQLGMLAVFALGAALYLHSTQQMPRGLLWCAALVAAVVCAASSSRVALVAWLLTTVLTALWWRRRSLKLATLLAATALFALVQLAWLIKGSAVISGDTQVVFSRSVDAGRLSMLHDAFALWQQHPVLGVGQGNYAAARLHELTGPMKGLSADHAHNLLAQALAEWGGVGFLLVASLCGLMLSVVWRRLRDPKAGAEELMAATWVVGLMAHSMVEHPLWFMQFLLPLALMAGLLKQPLLVDRPANAPRAPWIHGVALAATIAACGFGAWDYARIQTIAMRLYASEQQPADKKTAVKLTEVAELDSLTLYPRYPRIILSMMLPLSEDFADVKLGIAKQAMDSLPSSDGVARYALFAVLADKEDEARQFLKDFAKRMPLQYDVAYDHMATWASADPRLMLFMATLPEGRPLPPAASLAPPPLPVRAPPR